jgi:hypothetical protein
MKLIESKTLATAAASIEFTSIPQDGTDLLVLTALRNSTPATGWADALIRPNGATTNLSSKALYGTGSTAGSLPNSTDIYHQAVNGGSTSNTFSNSIIYITNYAGNTAKSISVDTVTEQNTTAALQAITAGLWNNTAAITSLTIVPSADSFEAGCIISLYKITKGSDGIVTTS